eukprot:gene30238-39450_t
MLDDEFLIAMECYEKYFEEKAFKLKTGQDSTPIHIDNISEAIRFAESALKLNYYHIEARELLSKWKMEDRVKKNHYDVEARSVLSYLEKLKWRSIFAYEDHCATVIQKFVRKKLARWRSSVRERELLLRRAAEVLKKIHRKPYDQKLRREVRAVTNSRFCPTKHPIRQLRIQIDEEDKAVKAQCGGDQDSKVYSQAAVQTSSTKYCAAHSTKKVAQVRIPESRFEPPQNVLYTIPGFRAHTKAFDSLMMQKTIICCGSDAPEVIRQHIGGDHTLTIASFSAADCLMLSLLLFLHIDAVVSGNPTWEFDLLPALRQCVSVTGVSVCGGCYTETFLSGLFHLVKVDNPRIVDLRIELMHPSSANSTSSQTSRTPPATVVASTCPLSPLFLSGVADLLSDYFNYCLPGLRNLNLHGCGLTDEKVGALSIGNSNGEQHLTLTQQHRPGDDLHDGLTLKATIDASGSVV